MKNVRASYLRTFVFGVEDSLASTVGLLSGVAAANMSREGIFLTGVVLIFVEAVSMAAGSFLSEESSENYLTKKDAVRRVPVIESAIMFFSYVFSGIIPLSPYFILEGDEAFKVSIYLSLVSLFLLGLLSGYLSKTSFIKSGYRMLLVGGLAIAVGVIVGGAFN
ncbi:MAG: VIT1/CCC1 transporter family protein [Candidatus Vogelbacteria bacterium]|nr:VIT1/CCC1 transporter family protein [Candidatus Vogelbacteria bacterium]